MGIEPYPTPEDRLRALADGQTSVLESLAAMQVGDRERSRLDPETYLLVRLAIAPLVGSARVLSAASKLAVAGLLPGEPRRITPSG